VYALCAGNVDGIVCLLSSFNCDYGSHVEYCV